MVAAGHAVNVAARQIVRQLEIGAGFDAARCVIRELRESVTHALEIRVDHLADIAPHEVLGRPHGAAPALEVRFPFHLPA